MSWDPKDSQRQRARQGHPPGPRQPMATPATETPGVTPPLVTDALPTVLEEMSWGEEAEADADTLWTRETAKELRAIGMLSPHQWDAWSTIVRRGIREV